MSGSQQQCCCGQAACLTDCIGGAEIESGCCHDSDTLFLWCNRPAKSFKNNYPFRVGFPPFGPPTHELCEVYNYAEQPPVQAIYQYFDCFYRCIKVSAAQPLQSLVELGPKCRDLVCEPNDAGPCAPGDTCCNPDALTNPACCNCNVAWLSNWRLERLQGNSDTNDFCVPPVNEQGKWLLETTCHKSGTDLASPSASCCTITSGTATYSQCDRLLEQVVCVVHFERWWRIADCPEGVRIYVPGGLYGYQTDDLVPKWWIYACSGIPLYVGDLCDAVRFGVITNIEAQTLIDQVNDPATYGMPNQTVLRKLGEAGYIAAKDWRPDQRQAYIDLDAQFPSAGYGAFVQNVQDMDPLGPFRKRMTYANVGVSVNPLLRKGDVTSATNLAALQALGFLPYPGGAADQVAYDFWSERQWVYFRGRPGGWVWAGWDEGSGQIEIDSILLGNGRNDTNCVAAFYGEPRQPPTCTPCSGNCATPMGLTLCGCGTCPTHTSPVIACAPDTFSTKEGVVTTPCQNLSVTALCEGLVLHSTYYEIRGDTTYDAINNQCLLEPRWRCETETTSYLVEARRSVDSWLDSVPYTCQRERPPLPVFNSWPDLSHDHKSHVSICNYINGCVAQPGFVTYTSADLCCGGYCFSCPQGPDPIANFCGIVACGPDFKDCEVGECPPALTQDQIDCIGYLPDCTEP